MLDKCIVVSLCLVFTSCGSLTVFQEEVPSPNIKNELHLEEEKKGAFYLSLHTKDEEKKLANALSRSLGTPVNSSENPKEIEGNLLRYAGEYEKGFYNLNNQLGNYQNKKIEGTGWDLSPLFSTLGIIAILALFILFPSLITVLFFLLKRTKLALGNVVKSISEYNESNPNNAKDLQDILDRKLDRVEKELKRKLEDG